MVALSEAYKDHKPLLPNQITPLEFNSASPAVVPESHDWSDSGGGFPAIKSLGVSLPRVDLSDPEAGPTISRACEEWGAFLLTGHGVPAALTAEAEAETRRLFSLPADRKIRALRSAGGATGYGTARITPFFPKHMWHEGFTIIGSPQRHAQQLWPLGTCSQRFCEVMEEYEKQMKQVAEKIIRLLLRTLKISEEEVHWLHQLDRDPDEAHGSVPCTALQLNSYPTCPDPNRAVGLAQHTDTFLLTVVHQTDGADDGQLQLLHGSSGEWVPVPASEGTLVVNVGDLMEVLSDGRFKSVLHRVALNRTRQRYSFAYFYGPPLDFRISPAAAADRIPVYRSVTVKEYVDIKGKSLDNALSLIRV